MDIFNFSKKYKDSINADLKSHQLLNKRIRNLSQMLKTMEKKEYEQRIKNKELRKKLEKAEKIIKKLSQENKKMKIIAIYDKKAQTYGHPIVSPNLAVATRDFAAACQDEKSTMAKYPEDIELAYIGDFDEITGEIKKADNITIIAKATEYISNGKGNN